MKNKGENGYSVVGDNFLAYFYHKMNVML